MGTLNPDLLSKDLDAVMNDAVALKDQYRKPTLMPELILLALLAVAQVAHVHSIETDADHCPLCIVMHSAVPIAVAAVAITLIRVGTPMPNIAVRAAVLPYWLPSLFVRPPPPLG